MTLADSSAWMLVWAVPYPIKQNFLALLTFYIFSGCWFSVLQVIRNSLCTLNHWLFWICQALLVHKVHKFVWWAVCLNRMWVKGSSQNDQVLSYAQSWLPSEVYCSRIAIFSRIISSSSFTPFVSFSNKLCDWARVLICFSVSCGLWAHQIHSDKAYSQCVWPKLPLQLWEVSGQQGNIGEGLEWRSQWVRTSLMEARWVNEV